jgi:Arc/MetJ-type ribon-helix-helix transcriptional regulator
MKRERTAVSLPADVYSKLEEKVKGTDFGSVDEYVLSILEEVLKDEGKREERAHSGENDKEGKERLKVLVLSVLEQM